MLELDHIGTRLCWNSIALEPDYFEALIVAHLVHHLDDLECNLLSVK